ncbi:N-acetylneuraminate synthase [Nodularia spumigena]|uniref:N-acetylneuraminate synthase n=1 Tax=Nodularia spumigena TaxID=70799 RepID=UPI00232CB573|nr:N-acetylneuraminate synthase [Nodularia spumigena]MDB9357946.1 N-acetylneuraminate synthase [Nodularia spumigena CS-587/03]MDB9498615.1 N-acetylneuraminate synthase [Nodularia spumigena CS-336/02]MDB9530360.1 N-acetylneuraminate synthase [Nodularia spumigena CS-1038]
MSNFFCDVSRAYLIAEIGVNHNGDVDLAKQMIDAAKKAGADAVKFQTFSADSLVSLETPKVNYQKNTTSPDETHYDMIRRLELDHQAHYELFNYCTEKSIDFLSTPYDVDSAQFLLKLGVKLFKTASADIVDLPLQRYIASTGNPTIVATGMAGLGEIEQVVDLYEEVGNPNLVLLHCVSNYPCSDQSLNLRAMNTLAQAFSLPVGFSDHSEGFLAAVIAVSMGAKVIEKHFTLDKAMSGPDHRASSTPEEFAQLVQNVRRAEVMLGSPRKTCQSEERQMATVSRKSIVLARSMQVGEEIAPSDIRMMRPGTGLGAILIPKVIGQKVRKDLSVGHQLTWADLV